MLYAGQPQARGYWQGNRFIIPPLPQDGILAAQPPQPPPSVQQPSAFQQQMGQPNDNGGSGSNTVGGAPTSTAAAPGGFSSSGQANRASSPSSNSPSMATVGSVAGSLAGMGLGVPGVGLLGAAIGTGFDVSKQNDMLSSIGLNRDVSFGPAIANNTSFGVFGQSPSEQRTEAIGRQSAGIDLSGLLSRGDMTLAGYEQQMSPISAAMSPMGLLGWGGYSNDLTALGSPGLGGYGNLGTAHSYGFVDGNLVGNFTGNEGRDSPGGGTGAMGGHGGQGGEGFGGSDPDGNGNWAKGGPVPTVKRDTVPGPDDQYITVKSGEYVIRPEAVARYGRGLLDAINSGRLPRGMFG